MSSICVHPCVSVTYPFFSNLLTVLPSYDHEEVFMAGCSVANSGESLGKVGPAILPAAGFQPVTIDFSRERSTFNEVLLAPGTTTHEEAS